LGFPALDEQYQLVNGTFVPKSLCRGISRRHRRRRSVRAAQPLEIDPQAAKSWSRRFDEPIILVDGKKLLTLKDAIAWLAKEIPKSEHSMKQVQCHRGR
jgi:hypothetical protein